MEKLWKVEEWAPEPISRLFSYWTYRPDKNAHPEVISAKPGYFFTNEDIVKLWNAKYCSVCFGSNFSLQDYLKSIGVEGTENVNRKENNEN